MDLGPSERSKSTSLLLRIIEGVLDPNPPRGPWRPWSIESADPLVVHPALPRPDIPEQYVSPHRSAFGVRHKVAPQQRARTSEGRDLSIFFTTHHLSLYNN
jgi:hypothetical protein